CRLLEYAGCEYGDLERLVRLEGVEGALEALSRRGVYLTVNEFKGRSPAIRGSARIPTGPARIRNPLSAAHVPARTSGSRGAGSPFPVDLAFVRERAVNTGLVLEARGGRGWDHAIWCVPGGASIVPILRFAALGCPPRAWFSLVDPSTPGLHARYRWSGRVLRWSALLAQVRLPRPTFVPLDDPEPIVRWLARGLRAGRTPHLYTCVSPAVRICRTAKAAGIDLSGTQFTLTGEPLTAARLAVIRSVGATAGLTYASMESGALGESCLSAEAPDDVHLLHDRAAVIQASGTPNRSGQLSGALLISLIS